MWQRSSSLRWTALSWSREVTSRRLWLWRRLLVMLDLRGLFCGRTGLCGSSEELDYGHGLRE